MSTMTSKRNCNPVQFQFVLQNFRSVSKNLVEFEVYKNSMSQKPEVVCLTETWLNPSYNNNCFSLNGYQTIIASNRKKRGGGVAFFLKNNINCQIVQKLETNSVQLLTVAIKTIKEEIWFSCTYMPPNCTNEANFLTVERYLDSLMVHPETKHVLCGNFNDNFSINSKKAESLKSLLAGNGLSISNNNDPTRLSNGRGTLIDAIFSNFFIETKVKSTSITDLHTVEGSFDLNGSPEKYYKALKSRNWHNLDNPITRERLENDLRYQFEVHRSSLELLPIDKAFKNFHELLTEALNSHLPEKNRTQKKNKNWIDNEVKNLATKKRSLKKLADTTGSPQIHENFQKTCKNIKTLIRYKNKLFIKESA